MTLHTKIRCIPDYPKPGILFRDITTLIKDPKSFHGVIDDLRARYAAETIQAIVGIESRGFIIGAALAYALNVGFVPIRKKGKLPAATIKQSYQLEYGMDEIEIHEDAIIPGQRVVLVDDLLATGGTAKAAAQLIKTLQGTIVECCFVVDLPECGGRKCLESQGLKVFSLCEY